TQTGFQVLGFLSSPSGDEIAYAEGTHVALLEAAAAPTAPEGSANAPTTPPRLSPPILTVQVGTVSLANPDLPSATTAITSALALALEYQAGDELVATAYDPLGQWGLGPAHSFSIDRTSGKLRPARPPAAGEGQVSASEGAASRRLLVRYETVELETPGNTEG